jgi:hypothetical protein
MSSHTASYSNLEYPGGLRRQPGRTAWMGLVAGFVVGLFAAWLVAAFAPASLPALCRPSLWSRSGPSGVAAAAFVPRALPREWRWEPPSVDTSGMFRRE